MAGLGERQLEFIRNYLRFVSRNDLIVLLMHIPLWELPAAERQQLFDMLAPFPHTLSFSAHLHTQQHRFFGAESGWKGRTPHHHINAVTVCDSWWTGAPDPTGHSPHHARRHPQRLPLAHGEPQLLPCALSGSASPCGLSNAHLRVRRGRPRQSG
ncbi:MAG: hypothetical protein NZ550_05710 [Fimbriimonadales bacterium]|nr:hypothetical protein [Fimbriimonadales bacterium]